MQYSKPASCWTEALPLGNGTLGAMIYGGIRQDQISLNLDSLWSGYGADKSNTHGMPDWTHIRELLFCKKFEEAQIYIKEHVLGYWAESYLPAGKLFLNLHTDGEQKKAGQHKASEYKRKLTLNRGLYENSCSVDGIFLQKELFVSVSGKVAAMRIFSADGALFDMDIRLECPLQYQFADTGRDDELLLYGQAPAYCAPIYHECEDPIRYEEGKGIRFGLGLKAVSKNGQLTVCSDTLLARRTSELILYVSGETNFRAQDGGQIVLCEDSEWKGTLEKQLQAAAAADYDALKKEHCESFSGYFDRVELMIGEDIADKEPVAEKEAAQNDWEDTDKRLQRYQQDHQDVELSALLFHYARYLMISGSVPGSQCMNLQGIWCEQMRAPWCANYTVNINTEMNYWMAESCNLSEFHEPLFDLLDRACINGQKTAQQLYGLKGWVGHHNMDLWGHSEPVGHEADSYGSCTFGMWNMSSGWFCRHLWDHYCYTLDREFLEKRAYPLIKGAVEFYLGYLTPMGDRLVTIPSTSPENVFKGEDGKPYSVYAASAMDMGILKELFANYLSMCKVLGSTELIKEVEDALSKLLPYQVGKHGQLMEWMEDFEDWEVTHRHVSHLYGLYPADLIAQEDSRLRNAIETTLTRRSDDGSGWCIAWKACLWARLKKGNRALDLLNNQMRFTDVQEISAWGGGTYGNLFCAHPPFQIDGNFGYAAAVKEMLLQSHDGQIMLLPALPDSWGTGYVKGLKVPGGYEVAFAWKDHQVTQLTIKAQKGSPNTLTVHMNGTVKTLEFTENKGIVTV